MAHQSDGAGGFLHPTLPSPPLSSTGSEGGIQSILPRTRASPLKPGSQKVSGLIDHLDAKLLRISRRYQKRCDPGVDEAVAGVDQSRGYRNFAEMAADLEAVIDVVWISATPSLQTPYLLNIALTCSTSLAAFPFSPRAMFHLLRKLDAAFSSLLRGTFFDTGQRLPGFDGGRGKVSTTEKVRLRGIVERTRVSVVEIAGRNGTVSTASDASASESDYGTATEDDVVTLDGMEDESEDGRHEMEVARVYEHTIVELGNTLSTSDGGLLN